MRSRRVFSVIALLSVLLHAGAVARHNVAMLGALLQYDELVAGFAQICHGGVESPSGLPDTDLPFIPKPTDSKSTCPVCSGLVSAFALVGPEPIRLAFAPLPTPVYSGTAHVPARIRYAVAPPARGPPARA